MGSDLLQFNQPEDDTLAVVLSGNWKQDKALPSVEEVKQRAGDLNRIKRIVFDSRLLADWDSGLLIFLAQLKELFEQQQTIIDDGGLPQGAKRLLALAAAVPEKRDARGMERRVPFLLHIGNETVDFFRSAGDMLSFIGDTVLALGRLLRGKARFRKTDLWLMVEACGAQALPIVSLICFLVGLILAFIGAIQLQLFGAQIYVADLVGIAMVRLMAAIMTGGMRVRPSIYKLLYEIIHTKLFFLALGNPAFPTRIVFMAAVKHGLNKLAAAQYPFVAFDPVLSFQMTL